MYVAPAVNPVRITECEVTRVLFSVEDEPYAVVVPKFTSVVAVWSVVQVIVAPVEVIEEAVTAVITGAGAAVVAKVKFVDVLEVPPELADTTA